MMNLKLQKAAQSHFVFVECYVVKLFSCVDFLERSLRFWIIQEQSIRSYLHFNMSQQI